MASNFYRYEYISHASELCEHWLIFLIRTQDGPGYVLGHSLELGFVAMGITAGLTMKFLYKRINKLRDQNMDHEQQYTDAELDILGDRAPTFRYKL